MFGHGITLCLHQRIRALQSGQYQYGVRSLVIILRVTQIISFLWVVVMAITGAKFGVHVAPTASVCIISRHCFSPRIF